MSQISFLLQHAKQQVFSDQTASHACQMYAIVGCNDRKAWPCHLPICLSSKEAGHHLHSHSSFMTGKIDLVHLLPRYAQCMPDNMHKFLLCSRPKKAETHGGRSAPCCPLQTSLVVVQAMTFRILLGNTFVRIQHWSTVFVLLEAGCKT